MKLSCCMIVRDDESTLEACLASIRPHVDELICVDTGSEDGSPAIAKRYADHWERWTACNDEQGRIDDFAAARNRSFKMATGDWVCWIDADDLVRGAENLRRLAENATSENVRYLLPYEYAHDSAGRVTLLQYRERLMRPASKFEWVSPVHELCMPRQPMVGTFTDIRDDSVTFVHRQSQSTKVREPGRNLRILRKYIRRVGDGDPRALYYYGGELAKAGELGAAVKALKRHIELDNWNDHKCRAMLEIGHIYSRMGLHDDAIRWFSDAMFVRNWPEPLLALGRTFYELARPKDMAEARGYDQEQGYNLRRAAQWLYRGLEMEELRDALLFTNPMERYAALETLGAVNAMLGDIDRTIEVCQKALVALPESAALRSNLDWALNERRKAGGPQVKSLAIPPELAAPPLVPEQPPEPGKLDLVLFLGPGYEPWSPVTWAANGMGGSETMAWEMARRLRKLGHRVRVYTHCLAEQEGVYEGVEWLRWERFRGVRCDVLIASRTPWAVEDHVSANGVDVGGCKYTAAVLWVHDVHVGDFRPEQQRRIDRILCLSEWHRGYFCQQYPMLDAGKVHVTRNGIDLARFDGTEERNPHRAIYSSSPDRGLLAAVLAWPKVREKVPDAELHCFYGFANWEKSASGSEHTRIAQLKHLIATTEGVVMRGKVSQKELAREFMRAGVWCYPTWFSETSCITAMEAQAAGCFVVTAPIAALAETLKGHSMRLKSKWDYPSQPDGNYVEEVVRYTVAQMTAELSRDINRDAAREHFGLDSLADDWSEMLLELEAELALNPVPGFKAAE
jgi:glycosyltransferase involved in cell wall biosynthesis